MIIKIVKIYLGLSLVLLYCGFSSFLASSLVQLIFLKIYRPLPMQSVVTTGFSSIACTFQGISLCYSFFCLLVSSVSGYRPDTKGTVGETFFFFQAHLFSRAVGREGGMLQTSNTGVCSQCLSHTGSAPAHGACSLPAHASRALGCSAGINPRLPWVACTSQVQATQVQALGQSSEAQTLLALRFVPFPGPSSSGDEVFGERNCCDLLPPHRSVIQVYNRCTFSGRC